MTDGRWTNYPRRRKCERRSFVWGCAVSSECPNDDEPSHARERCATRPCIVRFRHQLGVDHERVAEPKDICRHRRRGRRGRSQGRRFFGTRTLVHAMRRHHSRRIRRRPRSIDQFHLHRQRKRAVIVSPWTTFVSFSSQSGFHQRNSSTIQRSGTSTFQTDARHLNLNGIHSFVLPVR